MEIQGPLTVEELQEANVLAVPKLLRGSVRRRTQSALKPSWWSLTYLGIVLLIFLVVLLNDPAVSVSAKVLALIFFVGIFVYRALFAAKAARQGYERRIRRMPRVLSIDADGVRFEDRNKVFQFRPWSAYNTWREGASVFVLRGPQRLFNVFPKRGLTTEQIDQLRLQFATHMPSSS